MNQYRKRIKTILQTLQEQRYSHTYQIKQFKMKKIGYNQRDMMNESTETWDMFHCHNTWGGKDQHFCFKTPITLPEHFEGSEVKLQLQTGATDIWNTDNPQFLVYVDGEMICAMDMNHHEICLTKSAEKGRVYDFGLYAYANSEQPNNFLEVKVSIYHPEVEKLYYDLKVPFDVAVLLREDDLQHIQTMEVLNQTINHLDLRKVGNASFYTSVLEANGFLEKNYYKKLCGKSDVVVHSIGHTHIDVAWKWPLRQTREKVIRSFSTVLDLMNRYPEYKFMSSQPQLYQFVKEECPKLYEKIKERIAEGRWEVEGAMWLEADCNLTSGESLVRQILYGKQFFKEEFGKQDNVVLWLPDVFGYSAALPQILKKSGVKYFMTTKIGWNEYNQIPNDTMLWKGIDGSEVLTYFITTKNYEVYPELIRVPAINTTYNGRQNASQVMGTWQRYQNKAINQEVLTCYGFGDGGGGPTAEMLEESRRMEQGIPGCPRTKQTFVRDFFERLEENLMDKPVPKWNGELYLEYHRGTYTSMAKNKKYNRLCEFKNGEAEFFSILSLLQQAGAGYPSEQIKRAWELTMLNQFHDILPGTSIEEVYKDSDQQYQEVLYIDETLIGRAQQGIMGQILGEGTNKRAMAFNQLSFERGGIAELPDLEGKTLFADGQPIKSQKTAKNTTIFLLDQIPPKGYRTFFIGEYTGEVEQNKIIITGRQMETPYYLIVWNEAMELISIYDKEAERELVKEGEAANALFVFEDRPEEYDAWNIDAYYEEKKWRIDDLQEWRVTENGEIRACIYLRRQFMSSTIEQTITFYNDSRRIDFQTTVDWKESQLLLKAAFPMDIMTNKATYEIQYGNVERSTHRNTSWDQARFEVCAHKWVDVSESGYGAALLNDCKYGYDIEESVLRITLIKSGIFPHPKADQELHHFTYALLPHRGDFRQGKVIQEAYDLNCPIYLSVKEESGDAEDRSYSMFTINVENVIAEVVKKAEDNGDIIVRMYEAYGKRTKSTINLSNLHPKEVWECDLMENKEKRVEIEEGKVLFSIKPYEIKTFRVVQ